MKAVLAFLLICLASPSFALEDPIRGRMVCEVLSSRFAPTDADSFVSNARYGQGFSSGVTLIIDYTHDPASGLSLYLGEPNRANVLIEEPFPTHSFKGFSAITNDAEYRTAYSEVTLGKHLVSYKGSDQLFIKKSCDAEEWTGHYVQTYVAGLFVQVVSLRCRTYVDAFAEVLARLK